MPKIDEVRVKLPIFIKASHGGLDFDLKFWAERKDGISVQCVEAAYPPPPTVAFLRAGCRLPRASGVYFVYSSPKECVYVGKSKNMAKRVTWSWDFTGRGYSGTFLVAWLLFDVEEISFAECHYIGLLRPRYNFRNLRKHAGMLT